MSLIRLPPPTVKLIASSQVITSVSSVIKELMENSIDSGATHIEIKLEKNGFEKIEVKDDGCGIKKGDVALVCLPNYTSKITDFSDLDSLSSYGFRGEALTALCNVAQVSITTKSCEDKIASTYIYDGNGQVTCSKASHVPKGTVVTVTELFKNLPVRKQYMSNSKKASEELKKVDKIVKCLAMVHPRLRVTLVHNKFLIWQKSSVSNLRQSVMQVIPLSIVKQLYHHITNTQQIRLEFLIPKRDCEIAPLCFSNFSDASFLFINNRPVRHKEIEKVWYGKLFEYFGVYVPVNKNPISVMSVTVPADCIDVNLEPNKTRVYLKNQDDVLELINQSIHLYYGDKRKENEEKNSSPSKQNKKRKIEEECLVMDTKKIDLDNISEMGGQDEPCSKQFLNSSLISDCPETSLEINDNVEMQRQFSREIGIELVSCKLTQKNTCSNYENVCLEKEINENYAQDSKLDLNSSLISEIPETSIKRYENLEMQKIFPRKIGIERVNCKSTQEETWSKYENLCLEKEETKQNAQDKNLIDVKRNLSCDVTSNVKQSSVDANTNKQHCVNNDIPNDYLIAIEGNSSQNRTELQLNQSIDQDLTIKNFRMDDLDRKVKNCISKNSGPLVNESTIKDIQEATEVSSENSCYFSKNVILIGTEHRKDENNSLTKRLETDELFCGMNVGYCDDSPIGSKNIIKEKNGHTEFKKKNTDPSDAEETSQPDLYRQPKLQEFMGFSTPTLSQWSRGDVRPSSGLSIEGPGVLASGSKVTESPDTLSNRSVSSQMGCKEMSAFTKFARTMRKNILEEHPNTCFTKVAQKLQDKWRNLNEDERKKYEETKAVIKTVKPNEKQAALESSLASLNNEANIEVDINIELLKEMTVKNKTVDCVDANGQAELIGQLEASHLWLFSDRHSGLAIISSSRLFEAVKFHKHIESFSVPKKLLDQPIAVLPSDLKESAWRELLALSRSPNGVVTDPRITHNGFFVEVNEDEEKVQITHVAQNISYYDTEELGEVLDLMEKYGPQASLSQCRPLKVICFLRSEVMRDCLETEQPNDTGYIRDLLHYWLRQVAPNCSLCIHHLPVMRILDTR